MADNEVKKPVAEEKKKSDKPSFKVRFGNMWRAYKSEFKKIAWTPAKQVKTNFILVAVTVVLTSAVIGAVDYLSSSLIVWISTLISL